MGTRSHALDHVAVAVDSIADAADLYGRLVGASATPAEDVTSQGVRVAFLETGSTRVELLEPLSADSPVGRFLARRGPGLHHLAFRVNDLKVALRELERAGVELIDREPRAGAGGHAVAFIHPRSAGGVLVELVEHASDSLSPG